jgi:hypothetical protein
MPKALKVWNLNIPEEREDFERSNKSLDLQLALWDISQEVFRPHRKHGYSDHKLPNLDDWSDQSHAIVERLEELFYEILKSRGVEVS